MKLLVLIFFSLVFLNIIKANTTKVMLYNTGVYIKYTDTCVENLIFKSNYLKSIQYIEECVEGRETRKKNSVIVLTIWSEIQGLKVQFITAIFLGTARKQIFMLIKKNGYYGMKKINATTYIGDSIANSKLINYFAS